MSRAYWKSSEFESSKDQEERSQLGFLEVLFDELFEVTSIFKALLNELDDLVEVESNVCLRDVQQLQPFVLDPKRPDRQCGIIS